MSEGLAEALRWLQAAREDLAAAGHLASGGYHAPACFHSQQAAEKAVKALHYSRGARAVIGHSVRGLIERLDPRESALAGLLDAARELDLLYLPARYPNGLDQGTPAEAFSEPQAVRARELAAAIVDAVAGSVSP